MGNSRSMLILLSLLLTTAAACGYHRSGTGMLVPQGVRSIAIPSFINGTNEPYVDVEITKAVVNEFMADGRLQVKDVEVAELALRGTVKAFELIALSYSPESFVQQYKVRIVVDALLEDLRDRKTLWQEQDIEAVFISDYPVSVGDIRVTRIAKSSAIRRASQDIAWTLRSRVFEGF